MQINSIEAEKILGAAKEAARKEVGKVAQIKDALTPVKWLRRETSKSGRLTHLKRTERDVLMAIAVMSGKTAGVTTVRQNVLAGKLSLSKRTIVRTLQSLESKSIIEKHKNRSKTGRQAADTITISAYRDFMNGMPDNVKSDANYKQKPAPKSLQKTPSQSDKKTIPRVTKCHPFYNDMASENLISDFAEYEAYLQQHGDAQKSPIKTRSSLDSASDWRLVANA